MDESEVQSAVELVLLGIGENGPDVVVVAVLTSSVIQKQARNGLEAVAVMVDRSE